jgi:aminopeptidase N
MAALPAADQLGLMNDTLALGLAGYIRATNILELVKALPLDADPIVWQGAIGVLHNLDLYFASGTDKVAYRRFALWLLHPLADRLGLSGRSGEGSDVEILRASLRRTLGEFGDPAVVAWATRSLRDPDGSAADRRTALDVVASQADLPTFNSLLEQARADRDPLGKQRLYETLAEVQDRGLARRMVEIACGDEPPAGTGPYLLLPLAVNHPDLVWELALPHLEDPKFPLENPMRWKIAVYIASKSASPAREVELKSYEAGNVPESARRPFEGALAAIRQNRHIAQHAAPEIARWIAAQMSQTARQAGRRG